MIIHSLARLGLAPAFASVLSMIASTSLAQAQPSAEAEAEAEAEADAHSYIARIRALDDAGPMLNAVIVYDPDAPAKARNAQGMLQGRTILVKDNIETAD
jgi:amidase